MLHCKKRLVYKNFVSFFVDASQHQFLHLKRIGENVRGAFFEVNVMNWKLLCIGQELVHCNCKLMILSFHFKMTCLFCKSLSFTNQNLVVIVCFVQERKHSQYAFNITSIKHNVISIYIGDLPMFSPIDNNKYCAQNIH